MGCNAVLVIALVFGLCCAEQYKANVVVYSATASGAIAAIAAANEGLNVIIVEPGNHVGGMVSGGLGHTDIGDPSVIGGAAHLFFMSVGAYYNQSVPVYDFEPHVAEAVFRQTIAKYGNKIQIFFGNRVVSGTKADDGTAQYFITDQNNAFYGQVFIDASYEGDLLLNFNVSYTYGREANTTYNESLGGVQAEPSPHDAHQFPLGINPYWSNGTLIPLINGGNTGIPGQADTLVQSYNYRVCMTNVDSNKIPFPKPANYDPDRFELMRRFMAVLPQGTDISRVMIVSMLPNNKTDLNNRDPFSTDYIGGNADYVEASWDRKLAIWEDHKEYTLEFLQFMTTDPSVPAEWRTYMQQWGLAKDEFVDTDNWPNQLYVREARRMLGAYVMTQWDRLVNTKKDDVVGMGSYGIDSHTVQRIANHEMALDEGGLGMGVSLHFDISYGAIIPKIGDCNNLFVPVCLSASHVGLASIRMEPQYMILGQSSGVAAAFAIKQQIPVQNVNITQLQERLKELGQILS